MTELMAVTSSRTVVIPRSRGPRWRITSWGEGFVVVSRCTRFHRKRSKRMAGK